MSYSLPSLDNVFNIDLTAPLEGTYKEFIYAGNIKNKFWFEYGDSKGEMTPANFWGFLLEKRREPRLSWFYNFMKTGETFEDVLFDIKNIPQDSPFDENPVKAFREIGTTVFKSGWEKDDFAFVMRTGAFYNHQHIDQGSFWLADHGQIFIEERHLKKEGMLTVSASTKNGQPLVMANILTTTKGTDPEITSTQNDGYVSGTAAGKKFAFNTRPGQVYKTPSAESDAAAIVWSSERIFVALATVFKGNVTNNFLRSDVPLSFEFSPEGLKYSVDKDAKLKIGSASKPASIKLNGIATRDLIYDSSSKTILIMVQAGEGLISFTL